MPPTPQFSPHLLVVDASIWGTFLLGIAFRHVICGFYLFVLPVRLPSEIWKLPPDPQVRGFPGVWKLPLLRLPSQDRSPSLTLLPLFLSFIFCPTSFWRQWTAFLGAWCPLLAIRSCFVLFAQRSSDLSMNLWERKWSPCPIPRHLSSLHLKWRFSLAHEPEVNHCLHWISKSPTIRWQLFQWLNSNYGYCCLPAWNNLGIVVSVRWLNGTINSCSDCYYLCFIHVNMYTCKLYPEMQSLSCIKHNVFWTADLLSKEKKFLKLLEQNASVNSAMKIMKNLILKWINVSQLGSLTSTNESDK